MNKIQTLNIYMAEQACSIIYWTSQRLKKMCFGSFLKPQNPKPKFNLLGFPKTKGPELNNQWVVKRLLCTFIS